MNKQTLKKYGKHALCLLLLAVVIGLPRLVAAEDYLSTFQSAAGYSNSETDLVKVIGDAIQLILAFLGVILILYIIWAGWMWMSAGGADDKVKKAQTMIKNAIIGMIVIFAAYAITSFVIENLTSVTGADITTGS